jgi:hypothetical protein
MNLGPSEEQQEILDLIKQGNNVMTDSVAGSGKTTTILFLASELANKRILTVTYNSRLKAETRERVRKYGLKNIEVHSYHSLGLAHYTKPCMNDIHLANIVKHRMIPHPTPQADILVLDETQDMTKSYYDFIKKVITDINNPNLQLFVMGDHMQCIYDFAQVGADYRYLTLAEKIYPSQLQWKKTYLRTSYRITYPMEWFVNEVVLGYSRMKSVKQSTIPVKYVTGNPFDNVPEYFGNELKNLFASGLNPGDVFILAPSIRPNNPDNPIKRFENMLVRMGIPCFVPLSDDEELKDEVIQGKVVFSSFHQSKGLERRVVIVASFSNSLYYTAREAPKDYCPNVIYVAITRSYERLYLWGEWPNGQDAKPLPFLRKHLLVNGPHLERIHVEPHGRRGRLSPITDTENIQTSSIPDVKAVLRRVTDLTRWLPEESTSQILELCKLKTIQTAKTSYSIPSVIVSSGSRKENVSDLNGIAIPTIYEHRKTEVISIQKDIMSNFVKDIYAGGIIPSEQKEWIEMIQKEPKTPEDYLKLANIYSSYITGYLYKIKQIQDYSWLKEEHVTQLLSVLESVVKGNPESMLFEHTLEYVGYIFNNLEVHIAGRADLIDDETLWEIKCVDTICPEHFVQLALYAWLWQETEYKKKGRRRFRLINLRTDEIHEITGIENLKMILDICLDNAFRKKQSISDEEFIDRCLAGPSSKIIASASSKCQILDD